MILNDVIICLIITSYIYVYTNRRYQVITHELLYLLNLLGPKNLSS